MREAKLEPVSATALARRHQLQRWDQRVREGRAVAAGPGAAERDAGGEAGARRLSYNAGVSACETGGQWQPAAALLIEMREAKLEPDVISYSAGISACEKGEHWQRAVALLGKMRDAKLEPNVIFSYNAAISACQNGKQWQRALSLLRDIRQMNLYPDLFAYGIVASMCEHGGQKKLVQSLTREMCGLIAAE
ncbi:unnamed protein product [Prorocentrum cordatum]|uniref:Pentacotripeptide-repeat region of PRORP domain-containing protein n=1 Tax=Prorocentrum cordatum TaxID=2364126 RepID=A0ABN9VL52_9DINO|nr:unnamed protein product [Polarella glacialis]